MPLFFPSRALQPQVLSLLDPAPVPRTAEVLKLHVFSNTHMYDEEVLLPLLSDPRLARASDGTTPRLHIDKLVYDGDALPVVQALAKLASSVRVLWLLQGSGDNNAHAPVPAADMRGLFALAHECSTQEVQLKDHVSAPCLVQGLLDAAAAQRSSSGGGQGDGAATFMPRLARVLIERCPLLEAPEALALLCSGFSLVLGRRQRPLEVAVCGAGLESIVRQAQDAVDAGGKAAVRLSWYANF